MKKAKRPFRPFEDGLGPLGTSLVLVLPVVGAALFYVWTHITTVQLGYRLSEEAEVHQQMLEANRGLRVEVAALKAPERLKELGRTKFGLLPPRTEQVVNLPGAPR